MKCETHLVKALKDHIWSFNKLETIFPTLEKLVNKVINSIESGGHIYLFGNGGSAADAQHIAAEFIGRFERERKALPAKALTTDTSILTCLTNDYSYDIIFKRQLEAFLKPNDCVIGISTSGNSKNVIEGLLYAKSVGAITVSLTGEKGGKMRDISDYCLNVPSNNTARIQEMHIFVGHMFAYLIEKHFADKEKENIMHHEHDEATA